MGRIINVASEAGVQPMPQMIHYSVTKSALIALSRGLAELTKGTGVTANCVILGPAWTDRAAANFEALASQNREPVDKLVKQFFHREEPTSLIQRFVRLEEIGETVVFIAGMSAANGAAYRLDGGLIRSIV
jgi:NAD(P)-dependent dehydrogenase (short-subunit alcohol dehydrogenase family)